MEAFDLAFVIAMPKGSQGFRLWLALALLGAPVVLLGLALSLGYAPLPRRCVLAIVLLAGLVARFVFMRRLRNRNA